MPASRAFLMLTVVAMVVAHAEPSRAVTPAATAATLATDAERCLTLAVAYEAGNQPLAGQAAVAEVVLNRVAHPAFPKSVCGVVFAGAEPAPSDPGLVPVPVSRHCQFTFACDGALARRLRATTIATAQAVARAALAGELPRQVPGVLHYHADYVHPGWADGLGTPTRIGAHLFYAPATAAPQGPVLADPAAIAAVVARYRGVAVVQPVSPTAAPVTPFTLWGLSPQR